MVWNQSGNNRQDQDPWSNQNNKKDDEKKSGENKQTPPDLDDIFQKIRKKITKKIRSNHQSSKNSRLLKYSNRFSIFMLSAIFVVWGMSGFYTIREAERGVVTRFGKFNRFVVPGLNWRPMFIDQVCTVNVETVRELAASGMMLTSDENVVSVEMNIQYRVTNPERYLFSVTNADDSLRQATDSALRGVIGRSTMDRILTEGRTIVRSDTQRELEDTIRPYNMGITVLDVNFQTARPPEEVKEAFDDAIAARENREQYVREAEAYANEVQPKANGKAQRILEEARAYKARVVLEAQGEIERFKKLLPEYKSAPNITRQRLYIETMERVLGRTRKILINDKSNHLMVLPLNQNFNEKEKNSKNDIQDASSLSLDFNQESNKNNTYPSKKNIMDQRRVDAKRDNMIHKKGATK